MINSTLKVTHISQFRSDLVNFNGQSAFGSCVASTLLPCDLTLTDDHFLTGGSFVVKNGKFGDKVTLQVVHPTMGVLNQFVTNFGVQEDRQFQFEQIIEYPAKVFAGLILRVVYSATADIGTREFFINYALHKILL